MSTHDTGPEADDIERVAEAIWESRRKYHPHPRYIGHHSWTDTIACNWVREPESIRATREMALAAITAMTAQPVVVSEAMVEAGAQALRGNQWRSVQDQATAALGAQEPPLEEVLGESGFEDVKVWSERDRDGTRYWMAVVTSLDGKTHDGGDGRTIEAAIRAAVQNAKAGDE